MNQEDLDRAIEQLLEERPNEEKPSKRRNTHKFKDLYRRVLRGENILTTKIIEDVLQNHFKEPIRRVDISYRKQFISRGEEVHKSISKEEVAENNGIHYDRVRLKPRRKLNLETWTMEDTNHNLVYLELYRPILVYIGLNNTKLWEVNELYIMGAGHIHKPIPEGKHIYTEEIREAIKVNLHVEPPEEIGEQIIRLYSFEPRALLNLDVTGKYDVYKRALEGWNHTNMYDKVIPRRVGNPTSAKKNLVRFLNSGNNNMYGTTVENKINEYLYPNRDSSIDIYNRYSNYDFGASAWDVESIRENCIAPYQWEGNFDHVTLEKLILNFEYAYDEYEEYYW